MDEVGEIEVERLVARRPRPGGRDEDGGGSGTTSTNVPSASVVVLRSIPWRSRGSRRRRSVGVVVASIRVPRISAAAAVSGRGGQHTVIQKES